MQTLNLSLTLQTLKPSVANFLSFRTYGGKQVNMSLGLRQTFFWRFVIPDISTSILCADFLCHYGLLIDLHNTSLFDLMTSLKSLRTFSVCTHNAFSMVFEYVAEPYSVSEPVKQFSTTSTLLALLYFLSSIHYHLECIFRRQLEASLIVNVMTCKYLQRQVSFFGHLITSDITQPDPDKVHAIKSLPLLKTIKDLRRFLFGPKIKDSRLIA